MDFFKSELTTLKNLGCSGIKISFEDEGALLNEVSTIRYVTSISQLELSIKIGGCEAKRDIVDCINTGCDSIVAPMVESDFALKKYIKSLEQYKYNNKKGFNLETINAYKNIDNLIPILNKIDFVTIGRVDFTNSMNKDRSFVDTDEMYEIVEKIFKSVKLFDPKIKCYLGGAISVYSKKFIKKLFDLKLIDNFETRYVIFDTHKIDFNNFDDLIFLANRFELEWLKYLYNRYINFANKDIERIKMIEERININKK
jgi:hypothetical protein